MELRQPIDEAVEPRGLRVRRAIPARVVVGAPEPKVRAEIDDAIGEGRELINAARRAAVRQAQEQQIHRARAPRTARISAPFAAAGWGA